VINTELVLADLGSLQKRRDRLQKQLHAGDKTAKIENVIIEKLLTHLDAGKPAITAELTPGRKGDRPQLFPAYVEADDFCLQRCGIRLSCCSRHR